jgi:hypothetical protein
MTKSRKKLRGKVEKVIKPVHPSEPEKAQITIEDAEHLYREIRVENVLTDDQGEKARLSQEQRLMSFSKPIPTIPSRNASPGPDPRVAKNSGASQVRL